MAKADFSLGEKPKCDDADDVDDPTCGCMDPNAANYNENATQQKYNNISGSYFCAYASCADVPVSGCGLYLNGVGDGAIFDIFKPFTADYTPDSCVNDENENGYRCFKDENGTRTIIYDAYINYYDIWDVDDKCAWAGSNCGCKDPYALNYYGGASKHYQDHCRYDSCANAPSGGCLVNGQINAIVLDETACTGTFCKYDPIRAPLVRSPVNITQQDTCGYDPTIWEESTDWGNHPAECGCMDPNAKNFYANATKQHAWVADGATLYGCNYYARIAPVAGCQVYGEVNTYFQVGGTCPEDGRDFTCDTGAGFVGEEYNTTVQCPSGIGTYEATCTNGVLGGRDNCAPPEDSADDESADDDSADDDSADTPNTSAQTPNVPSGNCSEITSAEEYINAQCCQC